MKEKINNSIARPPVVVMMGHIDHGKSTLLDYIRKTKVTEKEAGGITQHISAYEAEVIIGDNPLSSRRKITFLDTPGHEAFCSVRERGARIADIVVLVISVEDGVKPQTLEILKCINKDAIPFVVALNKIDKLGVNLDKIKQNLAENGVLVEGWGGDVPLVPVSGKTGKNVSELLEIITLQSDLEDLRGDPTIPAEGFVIESNLNPKQGISATLLIKDGTLKIGQFIATAGAYAPVRTIEDFRGGILKEASFSSPIKIVGWSTIPMVGAQFKTFISKDEAIAFAENTKKEESVNPKNIAPNGCVFLTLVVKTDTSGSLEAVEHELQKLGNEKIMLKIIGKGIGTITEKDIKTANLKKSLVLGFNVVVDKSAETLALRDHTEIKTFKIIYELVDYVKEKIKTETPVLKVETMTGRAKILRTFSKNKDKQVVGGRVEEGEIKSGSSIKIMRREALIGDGKVKEIQIQKLKTGIAKEGEEFGLMIESKIELIEGDILKVISLVSQE